MENPIFKTPKEIIRKGKKQAQRYQLEVVKQMVQLTTAGFGLVAALAWNQLIRTAIDTYVKPRLGESSEIFSLIIYAVVVTLLAVFVTLQLGRLEARIQDDLKKTKG
ncbi:hypothetical protein C4578_04210 [Candidatus Microgenomates bacterium]|jgi:hypothetical protein|nr:MAG: hypothetical protein C4578_04210 [Candidatus Microgenomates bacterium]